jgi:hypothetical protein
LYFLFGNNGIGLLFAGICACRVPEGLLAVHQDRQDVIEARKGQREKPRVMCGRDSTIFPLRGITEP